MVSFGDSRQDLVPSNKAKQQLGDRTENDDTSSMTVSNSQQGLPPQP